MIYDTAIRLTRWLLVALCVLDTILIVDAIFDLGIPL